MQKFKYSSLIIKAQNFYANFTILNFFSDTEEAVADSVAVALAEESKYTIPIKLIINSTLFL